VSACIDRHLYNPDMARGKQSPAPGGAVALPIVSFTRIEDKEYNRPGGVDDKQARLFGCSSSADVLEPPMLNLL
jgi:hypothetical protein